VRFVSFVVVRECVREEGGGGRRDLGEGHRRAQRAGRGHAPRTTAPYHTELLWPKSTPPTTEADEAT